MQKDISDIENRLTALEKGKQPIDTHDTNSLFRRLEDEFIDLQAGFELQTKVMVEALQRKMNRNACQLSQELKFVCNQIGVLGRFVAWRTNKIGEEFHIQQMYSPVPEWPQCNWLAAFKGDFLDLEAPTNAYIECPPRFAHELSMTERISRLVHRRYFTDHAKTIVNLVDLDD